MIRPVTCLAFLLACGSGLYLYQTKHRVKVLDDQITAVAKSTDALREQTRMLSAEWTLLNDPERLRRLANQFLTLQTVSPNQFISQADLDSRLPPPFPGGAPPASAVAAPVMAEQAPAPAAGTAGQAIAGNAATNAGAGAAGTGVASSASASPPAKTGDAGSATAPSPIAGDAPATARDMTGAVKPTGDTASYPAPDGGPSRLAAAEQAHVDDRRTAPHVPQRASVSPPPTPERRPADVHDVAQRTFVPHPVESRPVMAVRRPQPIPASGSFLGMARDMPAPPAPVPLPQPMPQPIPYGGSGG